MITMPKEKILLRGQLSRLRLDPATRARLSFCRVLGAFFAGVLAVTVVLSPSIQAALVYTQIHSFGFTNQMGTQLRGRLIEGSDGKLYGTTTLGGVGGGGTVFAVNKDGSGYAILRALKQFPSEAASPYAGVIEGSDGSLYGTTSEGGIGSAGTVFKLNKDGSGYQILYKFRTVSTDGFRPLGELIEGSDGSLYGTTLGDGITTKGTVFKIAKDGSGFEVLHRLNTNGLEGVQPQAPLLEGSDGTLYGTTFAGGSSGYGTVFKVNKDGSGYGVLYSLSGTTNDGSFLGAGLVQASDSTLYGATQGTPGGGGGTIFKINPDGSGFEVLRRFAASGADPTGPEAELLEGTDGALYGVTRFGGISGGGISGAGIVFKLNKDGTGYTVVHQFNPSALDGEAPVAALLQATNGQFYGVTMSGSAGGGGALFRFTVDGGGYVVLRHFSATGGDGAFPSAGLAAGNSNELYGVTSSSGPWGRGAVFSVSPDGVNYRLLHVFEPGMGNSSKPVGRLIVEPDGRLFGVTEAGGSSGYGTIFSVTNEGADCTVLHSFSSDNIDGLNPAAGLISGGDNALYGTTRVGGTNSTGTVFKINKDGSGYVVLYNFGTGSVDGRNPTSSLVEASDGMLYGTTKIGGGADSGSIFKINKNGSGYALIHSFETNGIDGKTPVVALVEASDGALYGTTQVGGTNGVGTVFRLMKNGSTYSVIHHFQTNGIDGEKPIAALVEWRDGWLYGTTEFGGQFRNGTVFKLKKDGTGYGIVFSVTGSSSNSQYPSAELTEGADGNLYGVSRRAGLRNLGTLFRLSPSWKLSIQPIAMGFRLLFEGIPGSSYDLLRSTNLVDWETAGSLLINQDGTGEYQDINPHHSSAFYRALGQ